MTRWFALIFGSDITNIDEQEVWRKIGVRNNEETTNHHDTNYRNFQHLSSPTLKVLFFHDFVQPFDGKKTHMIKNTFGESIELTFETTNQRSHDASSFVVLTNRSWIGSLMMRNRLPLGLKDLCRFGCHIARCAERHFPTKLLATSKP